MKSIIETSKFKDAMGKINCIRLTRLRLPILSYAQATFSNGNLTLTSTDLDKVIRVQINSNNSDDYSILLPRRFTERFLHTTKNCQIKKDKIELTQGVSAEYINIKRGELGNADIHTIPNKEFPTLPYNTDSLTWHSIDGEWFCRMLKIISYACSKEPSRPILEGIVMHEGEIAAADGFRLVALKDARLLFGLQDKKAIIHRDVARLIIRLFSHSEKLDIAFELEDDTLSIKPPSKIVRRIYCKSDNTTIMAECIQGTYPNYEMLIPKTFICKVSFSVPLMLQRLNIMDIFTLNSSITKFTFHRNNSTKEGECLIQAEAYDVSGEENTYSLTLPVKIIPSSDEGKIAFSVHYIMEAINPFSICNWEFTNPSSPLKITGDIDGLTIIVMPMFVKW